MNQKTEFKRKIEELKNSNVSIRPTSSIPEKSREAEVDIIFSNGAMLRSDYWRLIKNNKHLLSSFDHQQKYGLSAPIDAVEELKKGLGASVVTTSKLDTQTGDLIIYFTNELVLQVLNFTGYEIWELCFADGTREYSNYNR